MQLAYGLQMRQQPILCSARQHRDSVLPSFAVTNNNLTAGEVQILHPQFQTLHQTQSRSVQECRAQPWNTAHPREDGPHFIAGQHYR